MIVFLSIFISTFIISLLAFSGILVLFFKQKLINKLLLILVSFSAGALLGGAFFHLLPETIEKAERSGGSLLAVFFYVLLGFSLFFILEQFIRWHHHHKLECPECLKTKPFSYLILLSDAIHNFIDGLVIAAAFIVSFPAGVAVSLAVAFHEIPQEIGDFGILLYGGLKKTKALFMNFISALTAVLGGIIGFFLAGSFGRLIIFFLPFAAGNFIYIASADLIPEIKHREKFRKTIIHFFVFLLGIAFMFFLKTIRE